MKKQLIVWTLVVSILSIWMLTGCGGDDKKDTTGPSVSIEDNIVGTWRTTSITMSGIDIQTVLGLSMEAIFAENLNLDVNITDTDSAYAFTGTYAISDAIVTMNLNGDEESIILSGTIVMNSTTSATYLTGMPYGLVNTLSPEYAPILFGEDTTKTIHTTFELSKQD